MHLFRAHPFFQSRGSRSRFCRFNTLQVFNVFWLFHAFPTFSNSLQIGSGYIGEDGGAAENPKKSKIPFRWTKMVTDCLTDVYYHLLLDSMCFCNFPMSVPCFWPPLAVSSSFWFFLRRMKLWNSCDTSRKSSVVMLDSVFQVNPHRAQQQSTPGPKAMQQGINYNVNE